MLLSNPSSPDDILTEKVSMVWQLQLMGLSYGIRLSVRSLMSEV